MPILGSHAPIHTPQLFVSAGGSMVERQDVGSGKEVQRLLQALVGFDQPFAAQSPSQHMQAARYLLLERDNTNE